MSNNHQPLNAPLHAPVCLCQLGAVALYYTYTAMEEEIERNKDHPQFAALYFPAELHRHQALACDLQYFYGEDWERRISCSPATQSYVARIHEVGASEPALLVAHAYTRYMGDLSGGQVLRKVAQRALKLPATGEGLSFYQFDAIHNAKTFKQLYRSRMNELDLDTPTKERVVAEANRAFQFNLEVRCLTPVPSQGPIFAFCILVTDVQDPCVILMGDLSSMTVHACGFHCQESRYYPLNLHCGKNDICASLTVSMADYS